MRSFNHHLFYCGTDMRSGYIFSTELSPRSYMASQDRFFWQWYSFFKHSCEFDVLVIVKMIVGRLRCCLKRRQCNKSLIKWKSTFDCNESENYFHFCAFYQSPIEHQYLSSVVGKTNFAVQVEKTRVRSNLSTLK